METSDGATPEPGGRGAAHGRRRARAAVPRTGVSQEELRRSNMSAVLARVHRDGPTPRSQLTSALGLNRSTIGDLTGQLSALGLVDEAAPGETLDGRARKSGRPSLVVSPSTEVTVLAVQVDVDRVVTALVGLGGHVLERREQPLTRRTHDLDSVVGVLSDVCHDLLTTSAPPTCLGIGVSVPGAVRAGDGVVRLGPNLGWIDAPLGERFTAEMGLPVVVANDANLGVMAESVRGAAVGCADAAYISGSVGIGGGFLVGGQLMRGLDGYAGEVGHVPVAGEGLCSCGQIGCWETKVGENRLLSEAGRPLGGGTAAVIEVVRAADAGEKRAADALDGVARWLGRGMRLIGNIFNPEVIVLGGFLKPVYLARSELVGKNLHRRSAVDFAEHLEIRTAALGDDSSLLGAAEMAFAPLLADPVGVMAAHGVTPEGAASQAVGSRGSSPAAR
jgi:predicted NBD/HSP70 family sugar kinase